MERGKNSGVLYTGTAVFNKTVSIAKENCHAVCQGNRKDVLILLK